MLRWLWPWPHSDALGQRARGAQLPVVPSSSRRVQWTWRSGLTARTASPSGPSVDLSNERLQTPGRRLLLIGAAARPRQNADKLDKTRLAARFADWANMAMQAGEACHLTSGATSIFLRVAASSQRVRRAALDWPKIRKAASGLIPCFPRSGAPRSSPRDRWRGQSRRTAMNVHAAGDLEITGLTRPDGAPSVSTHRISWRSTATGMRSSRRRTGRKPSTIGADEGFHANDETFLLHEVATNLPIYLPDTGPTDFHLICRRAAFSSCWSPRARSPSTMTGASTMSAPAR